MPRPTLDGNRPMDLADLHEAVAAIQRIENAGLLDNLVEELAHENCYPLALDTEIEHCTPRQSIYIKQLADKAQQILGAPYNDCLEAAVASVLGGRRAKTLKIISLYDPANEQGEKETPPRKIKARLPTPEEDANWNSYNGGETIMAQSIRIVDGSQGATV